MTIKTLIPKPKDGMDVLDQWIEKRDEIKIRFLDNIGKPEFPRRQGDIETIEIAQTESYTRSKLRYWVGERGRGKGIPFCSARVNWSSSGNLGHAPNE